LPRFSKFRDDEEGVLTKVDGTYPNQLIFWTEQVSYANQEQGAHKINNG
jgi:hypothetical protein